MSSLEWFALVKEGGAYCAPLLLAALIWVVREWRSDRTRFLESLSKKDDLIAEKDQQVRDLSDKVYSVAASLNTYLFSKGVSR